jgi:uridine kinase
MKPLLIGIAGPSGAGKTELARLLACKLPGGATLISLDAYYCDLNAIPLEERARCNFDHPDALDWPLIHSDVTRIAQGLSIDQPVYLFESHARSSEARHIEPAGFVILEGLFALYDPAVRDLLDAKIFVDAPEDVCLERRIRRDTAERGRSRESVIEQFERTVRPMARLFVLPTARYADLVISGLSPLEEAWLACRDLLRDGATARAATAR